MPKEIILPDDYTGTIYEENDIIRQINDNFFEIEKKIASIPDEKMSFDDHITDFEKYEIEAFFSDNKKYVRIYIEDEKIVLQFENSRIEVDPDGNIIQ